MKILKTQAELNQWRASITGAVGFVPTMGNLHAGHVALLEKAINDCQNAIMSIFVNPTQFGPNEDFNRYPRTINEDIAKLQNLENRTGKELALYLPLASEIYPHGFSTYINVQSLDSIIEGEKRPGHFKGVATVVYLLFNHVRPQKAYFGQKDYQQLRVIERMTKDLQLPIEIEGFPIVRDQDGLALSSRNQYLSAEQRQQGLTLPRTLELLAESINSKENSVEWLLNQIEQIVQDDKSWDYLLARNSDDLSPAQRDSKRIVLLGVYRCGTTRLLDNKEIIVHEL